MKNVMRILMGVTPRPRLPSRPALPSTHPRVRGRAAAGLRFASVLRTAPAGLSPSRFAATAVALGAPSASLTLK